jgi:phosphonate transport system permease protein
VKRRPGEPAAEDAAPDRIAEFVRAERPLQIFRWVATAVVLAAFIWSVVDLDVRWSRLLGAPADMWRLATLMFGQMELADLPDLLGSMWESIAIAWLGTLIAACFAVPLAFVAAENLTGKITSLVIRQVFNVLRAVPEVVLAIALVPIFGLSPKTGVVAIGIGSIGTLGKLCAEIVENVRPGPIEAADAVGASRLQRLRWGVLPQVLPEMTSYVLYRFEINIRASAVLGVVGAGGIGGDLAQSIQFRQWGTAGLALIIVVVSTIAVDAVSGRVRRRLVAGPARSRDGDDGGEPAPLAKQVLEPV